MTLQRILRLLLAVLVLSASVAFISHWLQMDPDALVHEVRIALEQSGPWKVVIFIALQATLITLLVPATFMNLAGGILFGPLWGPLVNISGCALGATLAFVISRFVAGSSIRRWIEQRNAAWLERSMESVESEGWRFVMFTRLVPAFPFPLMNYLLGVTRIRLGHYVLATLIGIAPSVTAVSYLGHTSISLILEDGGQPMLILGGLAAVAVMVFVPHFIRTFRRISAQRDTRR